MYGPLFSGSPIAGWHDGGGSVSMEGHLLSMRYECYCSWSELDWFCNADLKDFFPVHGVIPLAKEGRYGMQLGDLDEVALFLNVFTSGITIFDCFP